MGQNKDIAYESGDLVYCDVLEVAKHEWEFGTTHGRLRGIESVTDTWPWIICIVIEVRKTLKVAKLYIPFLNITIRAPFTGIRTYEGEGK
jgi:hypothetical protein|tara:strand:- start:201 stop:470 length:270 start_codon:yes stop_codon:yes gene_type:complete